LLQAFVYTLRERSAVHKPSNIYQQQAHTGLNPEILQKKPKAAPNPAKIYNNPPNITDAMMPRAG
jgi:hypothetical protein